MPGFCPAPGLHAGLTLPLASTAMHVTTRLSSVLHASTHALRSAPACSYGLHNAYFWVVSCLIMYTVALPGYAHDR